MAASKRVRVIPLVGGTRYSTHSRAAALAKAGHQLLQVERHFVRLAQRPLIVAAGAACPLDAGGGCFSLLSFLRLFFVLLLRTGRIARGGVVCFGRRRLATALVRVRHELLQLIVLETVDHQARLFFALVAPLCSRALLLAALLADLFAPRELELHAAERSRLPLLAVLV